jgi:hypothetical protein
MTPKEVEAKLRRHLEATLKSAEAAIYQGASIVMTEAKKRAPLDLGTLQNSGYVTLPRRDGGGVFVEAGFGGAAKAYAVRQHEESSWQHEAGRESHYLLNAINATEGQVARRIKKVAQLGLDTGIAQSVGEKSHEQEPSEEVMQGESRHRRKRGDDS